MSPKLVGISKHIREIYEKDTPVLITGETGTGKDVVANLIHNHSRRSVKPLVVKNCGGMQKELMRSELFGYVKGAFTGAYETKDGLLAIADGGTIFLDEIGELSSDVQGALLRFIETKKYRRVGDSNEKIADVRMIFATHRNLEEEVKNGILSSNKCISNSPYPLEKKNRRYSYIS